MTFNDALLAVKVGVQRLAAVARPSPTRISLGEVLNDSTATSRIDQFHTLWYNSAAASGVNWRGHPVLKSPFDLWMYQELIVTTRPDVIIETGTHRGGSALFFSDVARLANHSMDVVTIDFNPKLAYDPTEYRILPIRGISTADATVAQVKRHLAAAHPSARPTTMVILDSDHSKKNVLEELRIYADLVTPGQWLVVEDTNVNGHPVLPEHGDGPYEAVTEFLADNPAFAPDPSCERFLFTQNPRGWLRRIAP